MFSVILGEGLFNDAVALILFTTMKDVAENALKGENVAFVGQIGSGKSTMIKLLLGFQPLRMGHITIGGVEVNDISNKELRKYIFYIPQIPKLFNRTLYENIIYGIDTKPSKVRKNSLHVFGWTHLIPPCLILLNPGEK